MGREEKTWTQRALAGLGSKESCTDGEVASPIHPDVGRLWREWAKLPTHVGQHA